MQPTTDVVICNLALSRIGQKEAAVSIESPTTSIERLCALHYDQTRRELLRRYIFNFARKLDIWTADSKVPAFGFTTSYKLPGDFIRLMALGDIYVASGDTPGFLYDMSDGYLFCDSGDAVSGGVNVQYVFDAKNVTRFDPLFVKALRLQLAADMAYAFSLKPTLVKAINDELKPVLLEAAAVAGQEKPPRRVERSRIRDVRRAGGIFRNNTRI